MIKSGKYKILKTGNYNKIVFFENTYKSKKYNI